MRLRGSVEIVVSRQECAVCIRDGSVLLIQSGG